MSDKGHACGNCRFFRPSPNQCRKNPPQGQILMMPRPNALAGQMEVEPQPIGFWPIVTQANWCGSWEAAAQIEGAA